MNQTLEERARDLRAKILALPDEATSRFPDREAGLLIPNHDIADLKALVRERDELREKLEKYEAALKDLEMLGEKGIRRKGGLSAIVVRNLAHKALASIAQEKEPTSE